MWLTACVRAFFQTILCRVFVGKCSLGSNFHINIRAKIHALSLVPIVTGSPICFSLHCINEKIKRIMIFHRKYWYIPCGIDLIDKIIDELFSQWHSFKDRVYVNLFFRRWICQIINKQLNTQWKMISPKGCCAAQLLSKRYQSFNSVTSICFLFGH